MKNQCQHCNGYLANPSSLKRHVDAKHADKISTHVRREHKCSKCDAQFARKETLQRHFSSKHNRKSMESCEFCQQNFRDDYFTLHVSRCARKYWAKVCKNADLTNCNQEDQLNSNGTETVRLDTLSSLQPPHETRNSLRVVHEINIDMRLALMAFRLVYLHCFQSGDVESCLEAITASFRMGIPIGLYLKHSEHDPFHRLSRLANSVGRYIYGDLEINAIIDEDDYYDAATLLEHACRTGATSLLEPLFWKGAIFTRGSLVYAIESGSLDTVRFCLALGADPNDSSEPEDESNPLIIACAKPETAHIASLLIEYGANVFVRDANGRTPLHLAAQRADVSLLRVLLAKESSSEFLDATDDKGQCVLDFAVGSIDSEVSEDDVLEFVSILLDAGADAKAGDDGLFVAALDGCKATARLLLEREPESHQKTAWINGALILAIKNGGYEHENAIRILVDAGARVDDTTLLEDALKYSSLEMVELILKAGAQVDLIGYDTSKFLFFAMNSQQEDMTPSDAKARWKLLWKYLTGRRVSHAPICTSPAQMLSRIVSMQAEVLTSCGHVWES